MFDKKHDIAKLQKATDENFQRKHETACSKCKKATKNCLSDCKIHRKIFDDYFLECTFIDSLAACNRSAEAYYGF